VNKIFFFCNFYFLWFFLFCFYYFIIHILGAVHIWIFKAYFERRSAIVTFFLKLMLLYILTCFINIWSTREIRWEAKYIMWMFERENRFFISYLYSRYEIHFNTWKRFECIKVTLSYVSTFNAQKRVYRSKTILTQKNISTQEIDWMHEYYSNFWNRYWHMKTILSHWRNVNT